MITLHAGYFQSWEINNTIKLIIYYSVEDVNQFIHASKINIVQIPVG